MNFFKIIYIFRASQAWEVWLAGSEAWLAGLEVWLAWRPGGLAERTNGPADEWTDGWTNVHTEKIPIL